MGMFDEIISLDETIRFECPLGHRIDELQTKDLDCSMTKYVVHRGRLWAMSGMFRGNGRYRVVEGDKAVYEAVFPLLPYTETATLNAYSSCSECKPVLTRNLHGTSFSGDICSENQIWVEFKIEVTPESVKVTRLKGDRDEMRAELRGRGLAVLADDEPLAVAHFAVKEAKALAKTAQLKERLAGGKSGSRGDDWDF